jgi:NAD dependent epimerase/dehydratase
MAGNHVADDLAGRRVLVTGADGFIGSHLVEALVARGAKVRAFVFYNSWGSIGWLSDMPPNARSQVEVFPGDVRDDARVAKAVEGCAYVFHLASLIAIPYSYEAPRAYVDTNVVGALNVLQACRRSADFVRLLHTSTSEVYGTAQRVPIDETHSLAGQSPYSATKIGADVLVESFHRSFGVKVVTARPFNTFGPRQTARAVIPTIASQLLSGANELRLGALSPTRDFNYVGDTVAGMIALATCAAAEGLVVNIGSGEEWSIEQTARMLMEIVGRDVEIVCEQERLRPERSEVNRLLADNHLIRELTAWRPAVPFHEGLRRTVDWIRVNIDRFDPGHYVQ